MKENRITITVYGAEQVCASCVGAPGSIDTYEWLQAAIARKYQTANVDYQYVDIDQPGEEHATFVKRIIDEEWLYPIVYVNHDHVAEGIPKLKPIYQALDQHGAQLLDVES